MSFCFALPVAVAVIAACSAPASSMGVTILRTEELPQTVYNSPTDLPPSCRSRTPCPIRRSTPVCGVYTGGSCNRFCDSLVPCRGARSQRNRCLRHCSYLGSRLRKDAYAVIALKGRRSSGRMVPKAKTITVYCTKTYFSNGSTEGTCAAGSHTPCYLCSILGVTCESRCRRSRNRSSFAL